MEKLLNISSVLLVLYFFCSQLCAMYFWWEYSSTHSFIDSTILGTIISEFKGLLFPFFIG